MTSIAPMIASIPPTRFTYGRGPRRVPTIRSSRPVLVLEISVVECWTGRGAE
jgi:hypothetical protein